MSGIIGTSHSKSKIVGSSKDTAKAWCNFNGTSTAAIRDSFNISGITENGTGEGDYTLTFLTPMLNTDYCVVGLPRNQGSGVRGASTLGIYHTSGQATGSVRLLSQYPDNGDYYDNSTMCIAIF